MPTKFDEMCAARRALGKYVCVGLDPDLSQIPRGALYGRNDADAVYTFLRNVIDETHQYAMAYKPQSSYYEALGDYGPSVLRRVIEYIRNTDPTIPIILDYKRGDIGRTNEKYVETAFRYYRVDAVTIHPYLGMEAMQPFLDEVDKTIIVLVRTSNPGAEEFQDVTCTPLQSATTGRWYANAKHAENEGETGELTEYAMLFHEYVARRVAQSWNKNGNCAVVVGATYVEELGRLRDLILGDMTILIPGVGTQGGDLQGSVKRGANSTGGGFVINNSSGILFAYAKLKDANGELKYLPRQYATAAGEAARVMNDAIAATLVAA